MKWTLEAALAYLRKNDVAIANKQIARANHGIKTWGAIDYLCKVHGYRVAVINA